MDDDINEHKIAENSCFFQGHIGQYFTKSRLCFRITQNKGDDNDLEEKINPMKYRRVFSRMMQERIARRNNKHGSASIQSLTPDALLIKYIKLTDSLSESETCGKFQLFPNSALCIVPNCNQYFDLKEGKKCGHTNESDWDQITFVAFCDFCGMAYPFHYASNLGHRCNKCGMEGSMRELKWYRRDYLSSYRVRCINTNC